MLQSILDEFGNCAEKMAEHILLLRQSSKIGRVLHSDEAQTKSQLTHLQSVIRRKDTEISELSAQVSLLKSELKRLQKRLTKYQDSDSGLVDRLRMQLA